MTTEQNIEFSASLSQERFWYLDQVYGGQKYHNIPLVISIQGSVDGDRLKRSINQCIAKHESLRTGFRARDGEVFQSISPNVELNVRQIRAEETGRSISRLLVEEASKTFDLNDESLIRASLISIGEDESILVIVMHHIISDGWSVKILFDEIIDAYMAVNKTKPYDVDEAIQYADFSVWHKENFANGLYEDQGRYWSKALSDCPETTQFPIDRDNFEDGVDKKLVKFNISESIELKVENICQQFKVTEFSVYLSAVYILLSKYCNQSDCCVGVPIANRLNKDLANIIGPFANIIAIQNSVDMGKSSLDFIKLVYASVIEGQKNQEYPFEKVVENVNPDRKPFLSPFFQVMFSYLKIDGLTKHDKDTKFEFLDSPIGANEFDVSFRIQKKPEGVFGVFEYNSNIYYEKTAGQIIQNYVGLLESLVHDVDASLATLKVDVDEIEDFESRNKVDSWLADNALSSNSDEVAILSCGGSNLNLDQVERKSRKLAHILQNKGISAGSRVALYIGRDIDNYIVVDALFKLGSTVVVFDAPVNDSDMLDASNSVGIDYIVGDVDAIGNRSGRCLSIKDLFSEIQEDKPNEPFSGNNIAKAHVIVAGQEKARIRVIDVLARVFKLSEMLAEDEYDRVVISEGLSGGLWFFSIWLSRVIKKDCILTSESIEAENALYFLPESYLFGNGVKSDHADACKTIIYETRQGIDGTTLSSFVENHKDRSFQLLVPENCFGPILFSNELNGSQFIDLGSVRVVDDFGVESLPGVPGRIVCVDSVRLGQFDDQLNCLSPPLYARVTYSNADQRYIDVTQKSVRFLRSVAGYPNARLINQIVTGENGVDDCLTVYEKIARKVLCRVYVVSNASIDNRKLKKIISTTAGIDASIISIVQLGCLPLDGLGNLDLSILESYPRVDLQQLNDFDRQIVEADRSAQSYSCILHEFDLSPYHVNDFISSGTLDKNLIEIDSDTTTGSEFSIDNVPAHSVGVPLKEDPYAPKSLVDALVHTAKKYPDHKINIVNLDGDVRELPYRHLYEKALSVAGGLNALGFEEGDSVILQVENLEEYFPVFWGCILSGVRPLTVALPSEYNTKNATVRKLISAYSVLQPKSIFVDAGRYSALTECLVEAGVETSNLVKTNEVFGDSHRAIVVDPDPNNTAFYQLSSGSTGVSKCIQEAHSGVIFHIQSASQHLGYSAEDISLNWLPMDHVVPLLMCHVKDVYLGVTQVQVPTALVLAKPLEWLAHMQDFQVTHTWSPNFGYKLVSDELLNTKTDISFDLSSVKYFINAGEQVTYPVVKEFLRLTKDFGVDEENMQPSYGMAEVCTVFVYASPFSLDEMAHHVIKPSLNTMIQLDEVDTSNTVTFIDQGKPIPGIEIKVVDEEGVTLNEGEVGRVYVKSPARSHGYINNPEANRESFLENGWYVTGDLGFLFGGSLTITGREKELIIINGANYYCYDIEDVVNTVNGVCTTFSSACGVRNEITGTEDLVVFYSPEGELNVSEEIATIDEIRKRVASEIGVTPLHVLPVDLDTFPKTSSGKIQRSDLKGRYESGELSDLVKEIELLREGENVIPNWFFSREIFRKENTSRYGNCPINDVLYIGENAELLNCLRLDDTQKVISVTHDDTFSVLSDYQVSGNIFREEDSDILFKFLNDNKYSVDHVIVDLDRAGVGNFSEEDDNRLEESLLILINIAKNLDKLRVGDRKLKLSVIDRVRDRSLCLSGLSPFTNSLSQELEGISPVYICVEGDVCESDVAGEVYSYSVKEEIYLGGRGRYVNGILNRPMKPREQDSLRRIKRGGHYVITGGLGGIGRELAAYLQDEFSAHLLVLGREGAESIRVSQFMDEMPNSESVSYQCIDFLSDSERLEADISEAFRKNIERLNLAIDGVFHLAGVFDPRSILDEQHQNVMNQYRAKVGSTRILADVLEKSCMDNTSPLLVCYSSVNSIYGGATVGAYSFVNKQLEICCDQIDKSSSIECFCIGWSVFSGIGVSEGSDFSVVAKSKGMYPLTASKAFISQAMVIDSGCRNTFVGLNINNRNVYSLLENAPVKQAHVINFSTVSVESDDDTPLTVMGLNGETLNVHRHQVDSLPETHEGLIDILNLEREYYSGGKVTSYAEPTNDVEKTLVSIWQKLLNREKVGVAENFFDVGGNSLLLNQLKYSVKETFGCDVNIVKFFEFPTIAQFSEFIHSLSLDPMLSGAEKNTSKPTRSRKKTIQPGDIAIIGLSGRFPGASSSDMLWENVSLGKESIRKYTDKELLENGESEDKIQQENYVSAQGYLEQIEYFDAQFFDYSHREAEMLDPQQRLFLEECWSVMENAGYAAGSGDHAVSIFAGSTSNLYAYHLLSNPSLIEKVGELQTLISVDKDFLATRAAHKLNLTGPAVSLSTACSTSLVAVHQACQSLLSHESDMCIAGASSVRELEKRGYLYTEGSIASPDGHCRAFDADAGGTVFGNAVAVVVLKRLSDAERDGDTIHAVIKGSAINNDGADKVGYTAPSVSGQAQALAEALSVANVPAESVSYIEAHGTGTQLGDPIEIEALNQAYGAGLKSAKAHCAIGSLKTNVGHLDSAAGVAGLIKATMALKHKKIPASLHFNSPNPNIDFDRSPFYVNTQLIDWASDSPRRAGVSSFGVGGTNAHVILEEAPVEESKRSTKPAQLFVFSAKNTLALASAVKNAAEHLRLTPDINLADAAHTYQVGRQAFSYRYHCVVRDHDEALELFSRDLPSIQAVSESAPKVAFLFPGQGSQFIGMGRELYAQGGEYKSCLDECADYLSPLLGCDIRSLIFGEVSDAETRLQQTQYTQPVLFSVEYALAKQWEAWGVNASGMLGHSVGEYVAATLAGVFSLEDALQLIAKRGELIASLPGGSMLAVQLPEEALRPYLFSGDLDVAAVNTPNKTVVSGDDQAIDTLSAQLEKVEVPCQRLRTSHAFHSRHLAPILAKFKDVVSTCDLRLPKVPFISNVSGDWITEKEATSAEYWVRHLREAVRFSDGARCLGAEGEWVFLEVGPGQSLGKFVQQSAVSGTVIQSLPSSFNGSQNEGYANLLSAVGTLWENGVSIHWASLHGNEKRRRIPLPTYAFQRQKYWVEANNNTWVAESEQKRKTDVNEWLYAPSWKRAGVSSKDDEARESWLIFKDNKGVLESFGKALEKHGHQVNYVSPSLSFFKQDNVYYIAPKEQSNYQKLIDSLRQENRLPKHVVHGWLVDSMESFDQIFNFGYKSIIQLVQSIKEIDSVSLNIMTSELFKVFGNEALKPEKSIVAGLSKVIPQEYPSIRSKIIDLDASSAKINQALLVSTVKSKSSSNILAIRGMHVWDAVYEPIRDVSATNDRASLPFGNDKHYLIAGGLGGIGYTLAKYLASIYACRLTLVGRAKIDGLNERGATHRVSSSQDKIDRINELESLGAKVHYLCANIADDKELAEGISQAEQAFGCIHGVIHAAGIIRMDFLEDKHDEISTSTFEAKVHGLNNLLSSVSAEDLDLVVLCSSISSVVGGFGQSDYAASNAYLDAKGSELSHAGINAYVINWNAWNDIGMAVSGGDASVTGAHQDYLDNFGLNSQEAIGVFENILALGQNQTIVMPVDFNQYLAKVNDQFNAIISDSSGESSLQANHLRPDLSTEYEAPSSQNEILIAEIFSDLLGIDKVGVNDDFFELGGDSLLGTQLAASIKRNFGKTISVKEIFDKRTIKDVASILIDSNENEESASEEALSLVVDKDNAFDRFPLNDIQQAYWLGRRDDFTMGGVATHLYQEVDVGNIDVDRVNRAIQTLVERHSALRAIVEKDGSQRVLKDVPKYQVGYLDLSLESHENRNKRLDLVRDEMSHQVIDTATWPLFDIRVSKLTENISHLHISIDFILVDAFSLQILNEEFLNLYADPIAVLPDVDVSYRDYVQSLENIKLTDTYDASKYYWAERVASMSSAPDLPLAKSPEDVLSPVFVRRRKSLDASAWKDLKSLSIKIGVTPSVLLSTCFAETLSHWSKNKKFTLNLTQFNRMDLHSDVKHLVGDFTSLILLEMDCSQSLNLREKAVQNQNQLLKDIENSYVSGVEVLRDYAKAQNMIGKANMPIIFTSILGADFKINFDSLTEEVKKWKIVESISQTPQVWLDHQVYEEDGELILVWDAVDELFPPNLLNDMFDAYASLLVSVSTEQGSEDKCLPEVVPDHHRSLYQLSNQTFEKLPSKLLHELFSDYALDNPSEVAVVGKGKALTYGQLLQLAHYYGEKIENIVAESGCVVAVLLEKGWEQVVAVLSILNSGNIYIPISPGLPTERVEYLLEESDARLVLSTKEIFSQIESVTEVECVEIGHDTDLDLPISPLHLKQDRNDLAYVIFTSGSTGKPKGVMIDHAGAVNTVMDINKKFKVTSSSVVLAVSELNFDLSVYDIFGVLAAGGKIVIPNNELANNPSHWLDLCERHGVNTWNTVPALCQLYYEFLQSKNAYADRMALVMLSGDWIPTDLPKKIREVSPNTQIISLGGATEASIWSIYYPIKDVSIQTVSVPYGKALSNQTMHIFDKHFNETPIWAVGDIYIGGIGLAKGYWKDEEKTDAAFKIHPTTGERIYRTGDLGRYLPDGNIEFLGREDMQVKVQGYRIELGEIETAIKNSNLVEDVVVSVNGQQSARSLAAYYTAVDVFAGHNQSDELISDPVERAQFKLEQHGIRQFSENVPPIPLEKNGELAILHDGELIGEFNEIACDFNIFSKFMACFSQVSTDRGEIPKYYYPSAGSLNPIQVYMVFGDDALVDVDGGFYYYRPSDHSIISVSRNKKIEHDLIDVPVSKIKLYLIANMDAIEPLYGALSKDLCTVESGYMLGLARSSANALGLCFQEDSNQPTHDSSTKAFGLNNKSLVLSECTLGMANPISGAGSLDKYLPIKKLGLYERQSYRTYTNKRVDETVIVDLLSAANSVSAYVKTGIYFYKPIVEGLSEGLYELCPNGEQLCLLNDSKALSSCFRPSMQNAQFSLVVFNSCESDSKAICAVESGKVGQTVMSLAPDSGVGLCPMGFFQESSEVYKILGMEIVHYLLGGTISEDQKTTWGQDSSFDFDLGKEIGAYLKNCLPEYMIPSDYMLIEKIPLSANGKVDRSQLPKIEHIKVSEVDKVCPETLTEKKVSEIWKELLDIDDVGVNQNFFELGGNSITAIRVANKVHEIFDIELPLRKLLNHQDIRSLSVVVDDLVISKKPKNKNYKNNPTKVRI